MKSIFLALLGVIMALFVVYRGFTTLVILPFTVPLFSPGGVYFLLLVLLAVGATMLSFTRRKGIAALLAAVVGLVALGSWCRVIFVAPVWTWSNFVWFVVPEVCFSLAGLCKWLIARPQGLRPESNASLI
jgi:hypothetical protein